MHIHFSFFFLRSLTGWARLSISFLSHSVSATLCDHIAIRIGFENKQKSFVPTKPKSAVTLLTAASAGNAIFAAARTHNNTCDRTDESFIGGTSRGILNGLVPFVPPFSFFASYVRYSMSESIAFRFDSNLMR